MDPKDALLALSTFPNEEVARKVVRELVEKKLVACGNLIPRVESIYRWQGKIESSGETLVFFKLCSAGYPAFEKELRQLHPYEVPEIICLNLVEGSPDYLRWMAENCAS